MDTIGRQIQCGMCSSPLYAVSVAWRGHPSLIQWHVSICVIGAIKWRDRACGEVINRSQVRGACGEHKSRSIKGNTCIIWRWWRIILQCWCTIIKVHFHTLSYHITISASLLMHDAYVTLCSDIGFTEWAKTQTAHTNYKGLALANWGMLVSSITLHANTIHLWCVLSRSTNTIWWWWWCIGKPDYAKYTQAGMTSDHFFTAPAAVTEDGRLVYTTPHNITTSRHHHLSLFH